MKKLLLYTFAVTCLTFAVQAQTIDKEIIISGLAYSPDVVEINKGQVVSIEATNNHPLVQVSKETWDANGKTLVVDGNETNLGLIREFNTPGIYYFVCKNHVGNFSMKCRVIVLDPTGIESDKRMNNGVKIYPNPVVSDFRIQLEQATEVQTISLINAQGMEVSNQTINSNISSHTLNVSGLQSGLYQVVISTLEKKIYNKVVVQ